MANLTDQQLKETFDLFDADSSGAIDADELGLVMEGLGFGKLAKEDIDDLVAQLDRDNSGVIEWDEFQMMVKSKTAQKDSAEEIYMAFRAFDHTDKGLVTVDDLCKVAKSIGEQEKPKLYKEVIQLLSGPGVSADDAVGINFPQWKQMCLESGETKKRPLSKAAPVGEPKSVWKVQPQQGGYYNPEQRPRIENSDAYYQHKRDADAGAADEQQPLPDDEER